MNERFITIQFRANLGKDDLCIAVQQGEKAGYEIVTSANAPSVFIPAIRVWSGTLTYVIPLDVIHCVVMRLDTKSPSSK